jgi:hypothetical protein
MSEENTCNGNHWEIIEGRLYLTTESEDKRDIVKSVVKVLEKEIRNKIYEDICSWQPLSNRTQIMKVAGSMDAALLGVQAICADIALGKQDDRTE